MPTPFQDYVSKMPLIKHHAAEDAKAMMFIGCVTGGKRLPAVKILSPKAMLVGYSGKEGCFSFAIIDEVDPPIVSCRFFITNTPQEVDSRERVNPLSVDAEFEDFTLENGWGFRAMAHLKELRTSL